MMRLSFTAAGEAGSGAINRLRKRYGHVPVDEADVVVSVGGNAMVIRALHRLAALNIPIYPMSHGEPSFLTNPHVVERLDESIRSAEPAILRPLLVSCTTRAGEVLTARAFNEVALFRQGRRMMKADIEINGEPRMKGLTGDGVILSTAAGSTAYNLSSHGPILPLNSGLLALTPISPMRPRHWRGALVRETDRITISVLNGPAEAISMTADFMEHRDVVEVKVAVDPEIKGKLLFARGGSFAERQLAEQFTT